MAQERSNETTSREERAPRREERSTGSNDQRQQRGRRYDNSRPGNRPNRRSSRYQPRRKVCVFCADKTRVIDWKKYEGLQRFIGDNGGITPRRKNGLCAKHQRRVTVAVKQARHLALFPYTGEHVRIMSKA